MIYNTETKKVDDVFEIINGYAFKSKEFQKDGTPVLKIKNIKSGEIIYEKIECVNEEYLNKYDSKVTQFGDLLITMTGNRHDGNPDTWVGKVAWWDSNNKYLINQRVAILRLRENVEANPRFMAYQLSSWALQKHFISVATSSGGQANLSPDQVKNVELSFPPIEIQNKLANLIGCLEDKRKNCSKIINHLEMLAYLIFKRWFIDYEFPNENGLPYKSSGGKMVNSDLATIPEGWQLGTLDDIGSIIGGGTPSKKEESYYTENGISWITPKDLSNNKSKFIYRGAIDITELGLAKSSAKLMPEGSVLFSSRAPIGYIAFAGKEVSTNQGFKSVVCDKGYSNYFTYFVLHQMLPTIEANAGGSTFKEISGQGLKSIAIVLPPVNLVCEYTNVVKSFFEQIKSIETESSKLINIRDSLLPKLLSGEIEVPDESVVV